MDTKMLLIFVSCIIGIFIIGKMFIVPLKIIFKFILNSVLGAIIIWIINLIGAIWSFHIGINIYTVLTVGILGIPGAILLILINIFL